MLAELIQISYLIIWDEALMTNRIAFEALDRTLHDILFTDSPQNKNKPFGGKVVVLGGDFRQILHVIEGGARSQIVNVAIINSPLWSYATILQLTQNMRLSTPNVTKEEKK
jgi:ATP-dependent DNA helicase PIF1